jgi:hypothetical protein
MVGAGLFAAFAPAARAAGAWLLLGLLLAAVVALANATSSAQLAAQCPTSDGTHVYGRERLGEWWGFLVGWGFVIGKTASIAAMALVFAAYVAPEARQKPVAVAAVVALAAVNYHGVIRTARLTRVVVTIVLAALVVVLGVLFALGDGLSRTSGAYEHPSAAGILQSAALLFFAFASYARIATMGEEVVDPQRTIPRAVLDGAPAQGGRCRGRTGLGGSAHRRRRGVRDPRCPACARRRGRTHHPRDGAKPRPPEAAGRRPREVCRAARRRGHARRRRVRSHPRGRSSPGRGLLVVRGADYYAVANAAALNRCRRPGPRRPAASTAQRLPSDDLTVCSSGAGRSGQIELANHHVRDRQ